MGRRSIAPRTSMRCWPRVSAAARSIRVASAPGDADAKDVAVLPVSTGTEIGLNYRQWVEERRAYVLKASGGRLGYVHIRDMSAESLTQLYMDLDSENQARDGVVIDIRNNNGGFVNAYALDVFTRQPYLAMTFRGSAITAPARVGARPAVARAADGARHQPRVALGCRGLHRGLSRARRSARWWANRRRAGSSTRRTRR